METRATLGQTTSASPASRSGSQTRLWLARWGGPILVLALILGGTLLLCVALRGMWLLGWLETVPPPPAV